jgi:TetR/AcrR family transcriptional regulator, cholesterol catabolism regulator
MEVKDKNEMVARIIDAGSNLFRQYGMRTITMDEIARYLGISKKTLYAHFADKDELVKTVMSRFITDIQQNCIQMKNVAKDAIDETYLIFQYLDGLFRSLNPVVLAEMQKYHIQAYETFERHQNEFVKKMLLDNITWGIADELYRPEINTEIISRFRLESSTICMRQDIFPKDKFPMNIVQWELMEHYLYGIATPKGQKLIQKYQQKYLKNI